ncbi:MAG TPA: hypothetical protein VG298_08135 [Acidimicrobiales bacterium]|nr:hypothetical protein [Acidimicrobiales bacterium]
MTTTVESAPGTPVAIAGARGGPDKPTLRADRWWLEPLVTVTVLTAFVIYSTWAAFINKDYYVGALAHRNLISPFYSPCLTGSCVTGSHPFGVLIEAWHISPALLILIFPLGFRLTCYYYRKAYYRSFWWSPPACAVADAHGSYSGETRIPLILQNVHRYFFFLLLIFNTILTIDAVEAFKQPGNPSGWGVSVGALILTTNAVFLWLYSLSCHACRHFCGGQVKSFAKHPIRHKMWKIVSPLNAQHMRIAWISLFGVAICDIYVRLVASGAFHDPGFHF